MISEWYSTVQRLNVYNNSGEEIPPFACMELDFQFDSGKSAMKQVGPETFFYVKKPTSAGESNSQLILVNGPSKIKEAGYGRSVLANLICVLWNDSNVYDVGDDFGATAGEWYASSSGSGWTIMSSDVIPIYESGGLKSIFGMRSGGGGGQLEYFWPPSGGIGSATNTTSSLHTGVANCIRATKVSDGHYAPTTEYGLVENAVGYTVGLSGKAMGCVKNKWGRWVVLLEDCSSNTLSGNPLVPNPDAVLPNSSKSISEGFNLGV